MSHHLDTPLARQNGQLYIDDLYVFPGERSTVLIMDVNSTVTGKDVQPGFHPEARYEFKVHLDGADYEDVTYRVTFDEADRDGRQPLTLHSLTGAEAREDDATGTEVLRGMTGGPGSEGNVRIWAGRIGDPFYVDLVELNTINAAVNSGTKVDMSAWRADKATNSFAGTTVQSIVLEVSHDDSRLHPEVHIGAWCATKLATDTGGWRQINRAGHPMMWPIFWPDDTDFANPANNRHPSADLDADGGPIADKIASVVAANGSSEDPRGYGQTVARQLVPDVLPYEVGTPASYGFAKLNGRTLADNASEVMFSLVLDRATTSGLTPAVSRHLRDDAFPYVVGA
jgi:hypothetical protein